MFRIILIAVMLCITLENNAQIKLPALSPRVEVSQNIGLNKVELSYSRPSLRGRSLFGKEGVLPLGKKWRTGANGTSIITFSNPIVLGGKRMDRGSYAILSRPDDSTWKFYFYENRNLPYTAYIQQEALHEFEFPILQMESETETLSLFFDNLSLGSVDLVLRWGHCRVEIPIEVDEHESILSNIEKELEGPSNFDYYQAALYLHESEDDLNLALEYVQKATSNEKAMFFQVYREALILADLKRKEEAIKAARRSLELSKKVENDDFIRLNEKLIEKLSL